jgi:hypothetical protein
MRIARRIALAATLVACVGLLVLAVPSIREGVPGQLAQAQQECESATGTGVLALRLWRDHRSTSTLAAVQLGDASAQVTKANAEIATLAPDTDADLRRQRALVSTMAEAVAALNAASALIRNVPSADDAETVAQRLARTVNDLSLQRDS